MCAKKILIIFPGPLVPINGMSQVRAIEQLKRLSRDFIIDLIYISHDRESLTIHKNVLQPYCNKIIFIPHFKSSHNRVTKTLWSILFRLKYYLTGAPITYQNLSHYSIIREIQHLITEGNFNMVLIHYWYLGKLFKKLPSSITKAIDTHYVVQENIEVFQKGLYHHVKNIVFKKELMFSLKRQNRFFLYTDALIFNSLKQQEIIQKGNTEKAMIVTPNGQDLDQFTDYPVSSPEKVLLFYGALGNQFNLLGINILIQKIIPEIKHKIPDLKVMFVGANPPEWLRNMHNAQDFIVTGFVEDIRMPISKGYVMILPLFSASGFRGRSVEVMALGVPIIGSHNALDCLGLTNGENGFITDDIDEMIKIAIDLFENISKRSYISANAKQFVNEHYSIEATFGKLSAYIESILK
jgi:polysaccharide biosynthesis protein PslH